MAFRRLNSLPSELRLIRYCKANGNGNPIQLAFHFENQTQVNQFRHYLDGRRIKNYPIFYSIDRRLYLGAAVPTGKSALWIWILVCRLIYQGYKRGGVYASLGGGQPEIAETPHFILEARLFKAIDDLDLAHVEFLLESGVNPNASDQDGWSALHCAVDAEVDPTGILRPAAPGEIVKSLLDVGANPNVKTTSGLTALDIARDGGSQPYPPGIFYNQAAYNLIKERGGRLSEEL